MKILKGTSVCAVLLVHRIAKMNVTADHSGCLIKPMCFDEKNNEWNCYVVHCRSFYYNSAVKQ